MMKDKLHLYRFEFLLFALLMVIFNKIFFASAAFFSAYVWPFNMLLLGISSMGIFKERNRFVQILQYGLFIAVMAVPIFAGRIFSSPIWSSAALLAYVLFYSLIFVEVFRQITRKSEVTESIIFGSLSGFLLMAVIATFGFLIQQYGDPEAFNGITSRLIPEMYYQFSYFSLITLTTIGFGDITPVSDHARLLTGFWGVAGQFYMVALVGIIISKFST